MNVLQLHQTTEQFNGTLDLLKQSIDVASVQPHVKEKEVFNSIASNECYCQHSNT